jgi:hypothetical protein
MVTIWTGLNLKSPALIVWRFCHSIFVNNNPQSYTKMCRNFFVKPGNFFSAEIWKMTINNFWTYVMLRQPRVRASGACPAQKSMCLRVILLQKLFKGFTSSREFSWSICFCVICLWNKLEEIAQCDPPVLSHVRFWS